MPDVPETRYAKTSDGVHIAYQVVGDGPHDLVWTGALFQNIELNWRLPPIARFLRLLASTVRLLVYDPRGTGASDRIFEDRLPTLEGRMADTIAVMDAAGSERATVLGFDATGPVAVLTAATFPERTAALVLYGTEPCGLWHPDYPWGWTEERWAQQLADTAAHWGRDDFLAEFHDWLAPSASADQPFKREMASFFRLAASPAGAVAVARMERDTDVRHVLPTVHVPTLVLHRSGDRAYEAGAARYTAGLIAGAGYVELPGDDHLPWFGDTDAIVREIDAFLTSVRHEEAEMDRVLATVLFTDIVGSTEMAAGLGDRAWRDLLERHHQIVRAFLARHRGREVDTAGDGFLATFDGPARAVRCAGAISEAVRALGIEVRAGVHTGEVETIDGKVGGIAVSIGARVGALAGPGEVLVSSTVKDLVAGSGLAFEDAGEHELKGVPDRWRLFRVTG